jgi:hypothetical protein
MNYEEFLLADSYLMKKIDEIHDSFDAETAALENEENWNKWLTKHSLLLKQLPLPPSALIDDDYFSDFVDSYADRYPIEPFTIDILTDEESVLLLCTLDSYYCSDMFKGDADYRFSSRIYLDLCTRLGLPSWVPDEIFELPKEMTDFYLHYLENLKKEKSFGKITM